MNLFTQTGKESTNLLILSILARHHPHHRRDRFTRDRTLQRDDGDGGEVAPIDRFCTVTGGIARARQCPHTLVPAQSRRGDWEILWTDGSGSRLVLLLLLRPLAPSMHTVRGKRCGKRDAGKWAAMCVKRIEERRKRVDEDAETLDRLPPVYPR